MLRLLLGGFQYFKKFRTEYAADIEAKPRSGSWGCPSEWGTANNLVKQVIANYRTAVEMNNRDEARQWLSLGTLLNVRHRELMRLFGTTRVALRPGCWPPRERPPCLRIVRCAPSQY